MCISSNVRMQCDYHCVLSSHNVQRTRKHKTPMTFIWMFILACFLNNPALLLTNASCLTSSGVPVCCRGRQASCSSYIYDNRFNETAFYLPYGQKNGRLLNELTALKPCFCDEHCTSTGDCCPDYRDICHKPIVHCEVGSWGAWGACDRACGKGIRVRRRSMTKPALNGGRHCPVLQETTPCEGYQCGSRRVGRSGSVMTPFLHRAQSEVAHLLPSYGDVLQMIRQWNMRWDVRRKLYLGRLIKQNKTEQPEPEPYCAVYEITHRSPACRIRVPLRQPEQWGRYDWQTDTDPYMWMQGNRAAEHNAFWPRRSKRNVPPGSYWNAYSFFQNSQWDSRESWSNAWSSKITQLAEGQQICVTCYPGYMREDLGLRCSGTGLVNVETRWRALRTPDCHGKFRMMSMPQRSCTCGKRTASFIFV